MYHTYSVVQDSSHEQSFQLDETKKKQLYRKKSLYFELCQYQALV